MASNQVEGKTILYTGCDPDCKILHTTQDFAERLGVSRSTVWRWKLRGMPCSKYTGRILCKDACEWIQETGVLQDATD